MPNWCMDELYIEASNTVLAEIADKVKGEDEVFSIESFFPHDDDWDCEWCVQNWGTKWDVCDSYKASDNLYVFSSAWSPPIEAIAKLSSLFPDAKFTLTYYEPGVGFAGIATYSNGEYSDTIYDALGDYNAYVDFVIDHDFEDPNNYFKDKNGNYIVEYYLNVIGDTKYYHYEGRLFELVGDKYEELEVVSTNGDIAIVLDTNNKKFKVNLKKMEIIDDGESV